MYLDQLESVSKIELQASVVHDIVHLITQVGNQFRARITGDAGDVLHQSQHVAEHLFIDVHVFWRKWIGVVQHVEFDEIMEVALDEVALGESAGMLATSNTASSCLRESRTHQLVVDTSGRWYRASCSRGRAGAMSASRDGSRALRGSWRWHHTVPHC